MLLILNLLFRLNLSIHNYIVSTKIDDKRDDFNFDIVNFPFLDGDVFQRPSYGVYIYGPRSDKKDLMAIEVKSFILTLQESPT